MNRFQAVPPGEPNSNIVPPNSTYERSVIAYLSDPHLREFVRKNYLDEDLGEAVSRYAQSDEFGRVRDVVQAYAHPGTRCADLGAGRGLTSFALAQLGVHVTCIESDPSNVVGAGALSGHLNRHPTRLAVVRGDILCLPFASNSFEVVFCRSVLHHLENLERGLGEIQRILKPGGVFLALNEHILALFSTGKNFLQHHPSVVYGVNEKAYHALTYWWKLRRRGFRSIRLYGYPLEFQPFLVVTRQDWLRAKLIALPWMGVAFARLLHLAHVLVRRYLLVPEETLPAISIIACKPRSGRRQIFV